MRRAIKPSKRLKDGLKKLLPDPERGLLDAQESVPELRALGELYRDLQARMAHRKAAGARWTSTIWNTWP